MSTRKAIQGVAIFLALLVILYMLPRERDLRDDLLLLQKLDLSEEQEIIEGADASMANATDATKSESIESFDDESEDYFDAAAREAENHTAILANISEPVEGILFNPSAQPVTKSYCYDHSRRKDRPGEPGTPVQYIHIPKAGGTTIQVALKRWTPTYLFYLHNGGHGTNWSCPGTIDRGILAGHRGFGFCDKVVKRYGSTAFYIVSLREPVSHFRSFFDYTMNELADSSTEEYKLWNRRELSDLVVEYNYTLSLNLNETDKRMRGPMKFLALAKQQTAFMCGWQCVSFQKAGLTDEYILLNARRNMERADVVVVMERLNDMIEQLKFHVEWVGPEVHRFPKENALPSRKKSHLSPEAAAIIWQWSYLDLQIYELARRKHHELTSLAKACRAFG